MEEKKKKFIVPEIEIVYFENDDIITYSNGGEFPDEWIGEPW